MRRTIKGDIIDPDSIIIYLDVYTQKAYDIIARIFSIVNNASDSNTSGNVYSLNISKLEILPSKEIILIANKTAAIDNYKKYNGRSYNVFYNQDTTEVKDWIADLIEHYTKQILYKATCKEIDKLNNEYNEKYTWKRTNQSIINKFFKKHYDMDKKLLNKLSEGITVADVYCLYDIFKGTKDLNKLYSKEQLDKIIGIANDPLAAEAILMYHDEREKILNEHYTIITELEDKATEAIKQIKDQIHIKLIEDKDAILFSTNLKLKELEIDFKMQNIS